MAEWFKAAVLKTAVGESSPWVRIPLSPPSPTAQSPCAAHPRRARVRILPEQGRRGHFIMADESERAHPQSNAVRRQRALGAIRMQRDPWLVARGAQRPCDGGRAGRPTPGWRASRQAAKRRATPFACGEYIRGRACHPAVRLVRPVRPRPPVDRRGADGPRHRRGLCPGQPPAARHRGLSQREFRPRDPARDGPARPARRDDRSRISAAPASATSATA